MTDVTARFEMPDLIEQGLDNTLSVAVWYAGSIFTAVTTTGTVSVYDASGTVKAGPAAFAMVSTPDGFVPEHTFAAGTFSASDYDDGWTVEWDVTVAYTSERFLLRNEAALVRRKLFPVVTDADLFRRVSSLDPSGSNPITASANFQSYLTEAWVTLQLRLWSMGNRPNLIMSPASLRDCHLFLTLSLVFRDLATRLNEAYLEHGDRYSDQYERAWDNLKFRYDEGEDGSADDMRRGATSVVWLNGRR